MSQIFDVVAQLEGYAVEKFVKSRGAGLDVSNLLELEERMIDLAKNKHFAQYQRVNIDFHLFFINSCGNGTLKEIVTDLRNKVYRLVNEGLSLPANIDQYLFSHREIIDAVSAGDAKRAGSLMTAHVHDSAFYLMKEMKARNRVEM